MKVKTGTLKNKLSRYLRHVRETGETVVVLDRDTPVAELRPYTGDATSARSGIWEARARFEAQHHPFREDFDLPKRYTRKGKGNNPVG